MILGCHQSVVWVQIHRDLKWLSQCACFFHLQSTEIWQQQKESFYISPPGSWLWMRTRWRGRQGCILRCLFYQWILPQDWDRYSCGLAPPTGHTEELQALASGFIAQTTLHRSHRELCLIFFFLSYMPPLENISLLIFSLLPLLLLSPSWKVT